jgi:hypothetical protein
MIGWLIGGLNLPGSFDTSRRFDGCGAGNEGGASPGIDSDGVA